MSPLDDFLKNALRARLIPTVADSRKGSADSIRSAFDIVRGASVCRTIIEALWG